VAPCSMTSKFPPGRAAVGLDHSTPDRPILFSISDRPLLAASMTEALALRKREVEKVPRMEAGGVKSWPKSRRPCARIMPICSIGG
jgi:hypothetical protein